MSPTETLLKNLQIYYKENQEQNIFWELPKEQNNFNKKRFYNQWHNIFCNLFLYASTSMFSTEQLL